MQWSKTGLPGLVVLALSLVSPIGLSAQDAEALLREGVTRFQEGNYAQAIETFERAIAADPTNDQIAAFLDQATYGEILRMVASGDPKLAGIGRTVLRMTRSMTQQRSSDPDMIAAAIDETLSASGQQLFELRLRNKAKFGRNLVPGLVAKLADPEIATRAQAETWIRIIGRDAVPVLIAAARHPSVHVRTSVANLLGNRNVRHAYAAATLATMIESDSDQTVRAAAENSLAAVLALAGLDRRSEAKLHHLMNAQFLYLNPHLNDFNRPFYKPTVYHLHDGGIVEEIVLESQLNERMAGQALYEALRLDSSYEDARRLMLCVDSLLLTEYEAAMALYADDAEATEVLESQKSTMEYIVEPRLLAADQSTLFGGIALALADKNNHVAERLLRVALETERRGQMTPLARNAILTALLDTSSRRVRVQAAAVLAHWNPPTLDSSVRERVVSVLVGAVESSGIRVAHKIMGDQDNVRRFDSLAREGGLNIDSFSNSSTIERGIARAAQIPPDVVMIDDSAPSSVAKGIAPIAFFVKQLRSDARTASVPVIVVLSAEAYEKEQAEPVYSDADNKVWAVPSEGETLPAALASVLGQAFEEVDDARAKAVALGTEAAGVLAKISSSGDFPVASEIETLERVLGSRPESIRIPCLEALGNLRSAASGSVETIAQQFVQDSNSVDVREAAMVAVGKILDSGTGGADSELLSIILDGMKSEELRLRRASYFAYSAAGAPDAAVLEHLYDAHPPGGSAEVGAVTDTGF